MSFKSKNGITLIALVITIIVLLILAGVSISTLVGDNGVATKAKTAAKKFDNAKEVELQTLDSLERYISTASQVPTTMWTGTVGGEVVENIVIQRPTLGNIGGSSTGDSTGDSTVQEPVTVGKIVLPTLLNECDKQYILTIESEQYKGDVVLKVYGMKDTYTAISGVNDKDSYMVELRYLASDLSTFFDEEDVAMIEYFSDGTEAVLFYDHERLGEDLKVTKISKIYKEYTGFASILEKMACNYEITYRDALECTKFCIDSQLLGYDYVNELEQIDSLDEDLEMSFLKDIYYNQTETLKIVEEPLQEELYLLGMLSVLYNCELMGITEEDMNVLEDSDGMTSTEIQDVLFESMNILDSVMNRFTYVDWVQENEYLNEFYTRFLGNSLVPTTLIINDAVLKDINEDGSLSATKNFSATSYFQQTVYSDTKYTGLQYRTYADLWSVIGPYQDKEENGEAVSDEIKAKLQEVIYTYMPDEENLQSSIFMIYGMYAYSIYQTYTPELDGFYTIIHNEGIEVNSAGLKLGWSAFIGPESIVTMLGINDPYDFLSDTEYIQKQGVSGIKNELNQYINETIAARETAEEAATEETTTE